VSAAESATTAKTAKWGRRTGMGLLCSLALAACSSAGARRT
jgi:hypothetical protein